MRKNFILLSVKILIMLSFIFSICFAGWVSAEQQKVDEEAKISSKPEGLPKIHFDEMAYDFGKSSEDKILEHIFSFKNIGTGDLQIIQVKAG